MSQLTNSTNEGSQYTDVQRRNAIAEYAVSGNQLDVSKMVGIPHTTIGGWVRSEWGQSLLTSIRADNQDEMIAGYTKTVRKAIACVTERLNVGDYAGLDKDGSPLYKPVSARDSIMIAAISTDKMRLLSNQATSITVTDGALVRISEQLAAYAKDNGSNIGTTIDHNPNASD